MDPDWAALVAHAQEMGDWSTLGSAERLRLNGWYRMVFRLYEDAHYQFRLGTLDPELWAGYEVGLTQNMEGGDFRYACSQQGPRLSPPFRELVDSIIAAQ